MLTFLFSFKIGTNLFLKDVADSVACFFKNVGQVIVLFLLVLTFGIKGFFG
jgi:hypothetical protein